MAGQRKWLAEAALEKRNAELWETGACEDWFKGCDERVRAVACTVNAPLLLELATVADHHDTQCVEMFRSGRFAV